MTEPSILQLILGPLEEGQSINLSDLKLSDVLGRLDTVELTSPVYPLPNGGSEMVAYVRQQLEAAQEPYFMQDQRKYCHALEWRVQSHLQRYVESDHPNADRLYVLEFQGPWQYVMFGHTTNLSNRVIQHLRAASPHGYVLLNGWASPWMSNAQPLEQEALFYGEIIGGYRLGERFFGMPFERGVKIVRLVVELSSDWRRRPKPHPPDMAQ